jgi:hypothetical protein
MACVPPSRRRRGREGWMEREREREREREIEEEEEGERMENRPRRKIKAHRHCVGGIRQSRAGC